MGPKRLTVLVAPALFLILATSAFAHHGNAAYDMTKDVTLKGTVTEFDWENPHTQIYFDVNDHNGTVAHWGCETLSPGKLARAGWNKEAVKPGDKIVITLFQAKNGAPVGLLHELTLADGRELGTEEKP